MAETMHGNGHRMTLAFQSTSLLRGTTPPPIIPKYTSYISIHVPLTRDDYMSICKNLLPVDFNPRPSYEGRHFHQIFPFNNLIFQSTSLLRGTTLLTASFKDSPWISIHVPLTRDDPRKPPQRRLLFIFQSTSLLRGTTPVSIHSLLHTQYFNPRPSYEGRLALPPRGL